MSLTLLAKMRKALTPEEYREFLVNIKSSEANGIGSERRYPYPESSIQRYRKNLKSVQEDTDAADILLAAFMWENTTGECDWYDVYYRLLNEGERQ